VNFKLAIASLLTVAIAGGVQAQALPEAKPVKVPFKLLPSRHMLIEVTINDKGPYKLIFDTGAPLNIVTSRLGKETGISKRGGGGIAALLSGGMNQVEIGTIRLGDATAMKVAAVVMDHPTVKAISDAFAEEHGTIDGIVGFPFFARFATTVDYQKKELLLSPRDYKPGNYIEDLTKSLSAAGENAGQAKVVGPAGLWGFALTKAKADEEPGVAVGEVYEGTPAATAGLKVGDRVLTIDGRWTDTLGDVHVAVSLVKPGRKADVTLTRNGKPMTLSITPVVGY
jgi:hypothetical protein